MEDHIHGVVQEAKDRNSGYIRDIDSLIKLRRKTVGVAVSAALLFLFTEIPDEILDHPTMQRLVELSIDIVFYENVCRPFTIQTQEPNTYFLPQDILSYQKEHAANEPHNMATVYMRAHKVSLQEAIDWLGKQIDRFVEEFVQLQHQRFWDDPALDKVVRGHILGLGEVVRGCHSWTFEGKRYFGKDNVSVQESRTFSMCSGIKEKFICWETPEERST